MSDWLKTALEKVESIFAGDHEDEATQAEVDALKEQLANDEADADELKQVVDALVDKLSLATPPASTGSPT